MSPPFLSLSQNLALMAGAGAGKTHGLISLALHALGGARQADSLPPSRLCALTFTEKAAAEMKERLRLRVRLLAEGSAQEPDLWESYAYFNKEPPPPSFWQSVYSQIGNAVIGTFHSYCSQLLRRFALEAGLDPQFQLLEEGEAASLFNRLAEAQVILDLESNTESAEETRRLIRGFGFRGRGDYGACFLNLLGKIHSRLVEDGRGGETLPEPCPQPEWESARQSLLVAMNQALSLPLLAATERPQQACRNSLSFLENCSFANAGESLSCAQRIEESIKLNVSKQVKPTLQLLRESAKVFRLACADAIAAPLYRDFVRSLARVTASYQEEKQKLGVLDFGDLVRRSRDLLRDNLQVRQEAQSRVGVLLVDEFQDTNRLQLDLVALLCERRDHAGTPILQNVSSVFENLPLEPGMLACVGDCKQSIYEFRGADVSVFSQLAQRLTQEKDQEGRVEYLKQNRRSRPRLIALFNALFAQVMQPQPQTLPWQVSYHPETDDLTAFRPPGPPHPCAELICVEGETSEERRLAEARGIAARISYLLSSQGPLLVGENDEKDSLRRAHGRDIAILLRRFTHLEVFRQELLARSIPHVVIRGGGFFSLPEIVDLRTLLVLLGEPQNNLALCAVLRSPWVALSDPTLARLATGNKLTFSALREGISDLADREETERVEHFLSVFDQALLIYPNQGIDAALEYLTEKLDCEPLWAAGFDGEQKIANVRKLIHWTRENPLPGPLAAARRLAELASGEGREGQASFMEESDPNAVRIMTIHQAKGLEFPIVFVPECGSTLNQDHDSILFDRQEGMALKPRGEDGLALQTSLSQKVSAILQSRQRAESDRLFYVASTRARDLIFFSGEATRKGDTWRNKLELFWESFPENASKHGLLCKRKAEEVFSFGNLPYQPDRPIENFSCLPVAPVIAPSTLFIPSLNVSINQLNGDQEETPPSLARDRDLFLRLLLTFDFQKPASGQLENFLLRERITSRSAMGKKWIAMAKSFFSSPLGQSISEQNPSRMWRRVPFVSSLEEASFRLHIRGEIDLLVIQTDGNVLVLSFTHPAGSLSSDCQGLAMRTVFPISVPVQLSSIDLCDPSSPTFCCIDDQKSQLIRSRLREWSDQKLNHLTNNDSNSPQLSEVCCRMPPNGPKLAGS